MKKMNFLIPILLLTLAFPFAACKDGGTSESSGNSDSSSEQELPVELSLDKTNVTMQEDESITLLATTNSSKTVQWQSSNTSVASVLNGKVQAKNAGTATITATVEGVSATCSVTVIADENSAISYIEFENKEIAICLEDQRKQTIQATLYELLDGAGVQVEKAEFTYNCADDTVATVSENGEITPIAAGETLVMVASESTSATVLVDVYDETVSTPQEWLGMFGTHQKKYLLAQDIDFTGVAYTGYCSLTNSNISANEPYFDNTVNGNGHSVKNIEMPYTEMKASSLFGFLYNGVIKNIAFENVSFHANNDTLGSCAGIAFRAFGTKTEVNNVSLDLHFDHSSNGASSAGLVVYPYGGTYKNVFIQMTTAGKPATDKIYGISDTSYEYSRAGGIGDETLNNSIPSLENVLVYSTMGRMKTCLNSHPKAADGSVLVTESKMDAAWFAYNHLNNGLWNVSLTEVPTLKAKA